MCLPTRKWARQAGRSAKPPCPPAPHCMHPARFLPRKPRTFRNPQLFREPRTTTPIHRLPLKQRANAVMLVPEVISVHVATPRLRSPPLLWSVGLFFGITLLPGAGFTGGITRWLLAPRSLRASAPGSSAMPSSTASTTRRSRRHSSKARLARCRKCSSGAAREQPYHSTKAQHTAMANKLAVAGATDARRPGGRKPHEPRAERCDRGA